MKLSSNTVKSIYNEYHNLECFDARYYIMTKARELDVSKTTIWKIVRAKPPYNRIVGQN